MNAKWFPWKMPCRQKLKLFLALVIAYIFGLVLNSVVFLIAENHNLTADDIFATVFAVLVNIIIGLFFSWTLKQDNPSFYLLNAGICMIPVFAELYDFVSAHRRIEGFQTEEVASFIARKENIDYLALALAFFRLVLKVVPSSAFYLLYLEEYNPPILPQLLRDEKD